MTPVRSLAAALALLALAAGCSSKKDVQPPAALTEFRSSVDIQRVWSTTLSGNKPRLRLGVGVAAAGDAIFGASYGGDVVAFDRATGKRLWRHDTKLKLSGGPGAGEGIVVVGASHGDVVALDAATGELKWKTRINSEILSAPAIARGTVVLRAVDGRLVALRANDGSQLWSAEESVPRLSLRGTAQPLIVNDLAVSGFDNGRVLALQLANGDTAWELTVAPPSGRSELERLVDIDTAVQALGNDIYVVTYQGKAASINGELGSTLWTRDVSSYSGLALDDDGFYVTTSDGLVIKIGRRTGVEMWRRDVLSRRRLSAPAVLGNYLAVADLAGYVHFFDKNTGALAARIHPLGDRVSAPPVVSGDLLVMMDADGKVAAMRIKAEGDAASKAFVRGGSEASTDTAGPSSPRTGPSGFDTRSRPGN